MTQPPTPGEMARVDQAHADASRFIDEMLTSGVTELQRGTPLHRLFVLYGGTLHANREQFSATHMRVLVSVAAGRLAALHHAIEQLADQQDAIAEKYIGESRNAVRLVAAKLRKLVDP